MTSHALTQSNMVDMCNEFSLICHSNCLLVLKLLGKFMSLEDYPSQLPFAIFGSIHAQN